MAVAPRLTQLKAVKWRSGWALAAALDRSRTVRSATTWAAERSQGAVNVPIRGLRASRWARGATDFSRKQMTIRRTTLRLTKYRSVILVGLSACGAFAVACGSDGDGSTAPYAGSGNAEGGRSSAGG